jgi:hypothetical protein
MEILLPIISMVSIFGLYIIRTEQKIKNLELEKDLLGKITENRDKIHKVESNLSSKINEIFVRSENTEKSIAEIKLEIHEIYNLIKEEKNV